MIARFRSDIAVIRGGITLGTRSGVGLVGDAVDAMRRDLAPGEPARIASELRERMEQGTRGVMDGPTHREWHGSPLPEFLVPASESGAPKGPAALEWASPADADHPQHTLLQQIRGQTQARERDGAISFKDDGERERFCRYALAACRDNRDELRGLYPDRDFGGACAGLGLERADHLVIGTRQHAILVQGDIESSAAQRVAFTMEQARQTPIGDSDAKLEASQREASQPMSMARQHAQADTVQVPRHTAQTH